MEGKYLPSAQFETTVSNNLCVSIIEVTQNKLWYSTLKNNLLPHLIFCMDFFIPFQLHTGKVSSMSGMFTKIPKFLFHFQCKI